MKGNFWKWGKYALPFKSIRVNVKKEGIEEGYNKDTAEGMEISKIDTIKNMLKEGIDNSIISKVTGKTIDEIEEIEKSI